MTPSKQMNMSEWVKSLSRVLLFATPWAVAYQAPPSMGFSWSGLPFPSPVHESEKWREVAQSCPTLSDPMNCSPPGSSVHRIFQARVLEWGAIAFSGAQAHAKWGGWSERLAPLSADPRSPDFIRMAFRTPHTACPCFQSHVKAQAMYGNNLWCQCSLGLIFHKVSSIWQCP